MELEHERTVAFGALLDDEALLEAGGRVHVPLGEARTGDFDARAIVSHFARPDLRELSAASHTAE
ncbi:MAG TPA: hypothetical protein VMR86_01960 [Myxococcota bacterium]|nr:hypothetical protein [Myxococcota bacterium]